MKTVAWFSAGVSSAVATKLLIGEIDEIIYTHIEDQHPDTMRFVKECEQWFGKSVKIVQSHLQNVDTACRMAGGKGYINGPGGASCTHRLKRLVRLEWEKSQKDDLRYVWGIDAEEADRATKLLDNMPTYEHVFPLIDRGLSKADAHQALVACGIRRPEMYDLGYVNNNCVGCVKGGMAYWNKIRIDFPEVFAKRAKMERIIGATCIKGVYLDELDPKRGRGSKPIVGECGILCEALLEARGEQHG